MQRSVRSELESKLEKEKKLNSMMKKLETTTEIIGNLKSTVYHLQEECAELRKMRTFDAEDVCREDAERIHWRKYLLSPASQNESAELLSIE